MRYEEDGVVVLVTETENSPKEQGHKVCYSSISSQLLFMILFSILAIIVLFPFTNIFLKIIRGTEQKLLEQLTEGTPAMPGEPMHSLNAINDPCYVEDFLLTHRTFISSTKVMEHLLSLMHKGKTMDTEKQRVTRVILLWVRK